MIQLRFGGHSEAGVLKRVSRSHLFGEHAIDSGECTVFPNNWMCKNFLNKVLTEKMIFEQKPEERKDR